LIGDEGRVLEYATLDPTGQQITVEIHKWSNGDVWPRICQRSSVLARRSSD